MYPEAISGVRIVNAPHRFRQPRMRNHPPCIFHQVAYDGDLGTSQVDFPSLVKKLQGFMT